MALFIVSSGILVGWRVWSTPTSKLTISQTVKGRTLTMNYRGPAEGVATAWQLFNAEVANLDRRPETKPVADANA